MAGASLFQLGFVIEAYDHASHAIHGVQNSLGALKGAAGDLRGLRDVGAGLLIVGAAGAGLAYTLYELAHPAIEAESAMQKLRIAGDLTEKTLHRIDEAAHEHIRTFGGSVEDYAHAFTVLSRGVGSVDTSPEKAMEQATRATTDALILQKLGVGDLDSVLSLLVRTYAQIGDVTKPADAQIDQFGDTLLRLHYLFPQLDTHAFVMGIGRLGPLAREAGRTSLAELGAIAGRLSQDVGPRAAMQFTQVASAIVAGKDKLQGLGVSWLPTDTFLDMIDKLTAAQDRLGPVAIEKAFGPGAATVVLELSQHLQQLHHDVDAAANSQINMRDKIEELKKTDPQMWLELLRANIKLTREDIGHHMLPYIDAATTKMRDWTVAIDRFATAHPTLAGLGIDFAAISSGLMLSAGALGSLLIGISYIPDLVGGIRLLAGAFGVLRGAMVALSFNPWVIGIGAVSFALYELYMHWDELKSMALGTINVIIDSLGRLANAVLHPLESLRAVTHEGLTIAQWGSSGAGAPAVIPPPATEPEHVAAARGAAASILHTTIEQSVASLGGINPARIGAPVVTSGVLPTRIPTPLAGNRPGAGGPVTLHYAPTINISGGADASAIPGLLDDQSRTFMDKIHELTRREERLNY